MLKIVKCAWENSDVRSSVQDFHRLHFEIVTSAAASTPKEVRAYPQRGSGPVSQAHLERGLRLDLVNKRANKMILKGFNKGVRLKLVLGCIGTSTRRGCCNIQTKFKVIFLSLLLKHGPAAESHYIDWYGLSSMESQRYDDVTKWKHFPRYWPFVRGFHRPPVNFPHKGQWRGALLFSLICAWTNGWVNNRNAGDLRRPRAYYDVTVMIFNGTATLPGPAI